MKAKQKEEKNVGMEQEDLKLLLMLKTKQGSDKSIEELYFDDLMQENDIYCKDEIELLLTDETISKEEMAFMIGHMAS